MKLHLATFALIFLCSSTIAFGDATDDLSRVLVGIFSLTDHPSTDVSDFFKCMSTSNLDAIRDVSVDLIYEGANCNPTKIFDFKTKIEAVYDKIPQSEIDCVLNHPVLAVLAQDYNIIPTTQVYIVTKVIEYGLAHMLTLCEKDVLLKEDIDAGDWNKVGSDGGNVLKDIFGVKKSSSALELFALGNSNDDLSTLLGGLVSVTSASQADYASIAKCAGSATADHFLASLNELINEAATCNPIKAMDITTKVDALLNSFAPNELDCLKDNVAANQVIDAMGITGLRSDAIQKKIVSYIMAHLITACGDMHTLSSDLAKNDWTNFGSHAGKMLLKVFKGSAALELFALGNSNDDLSTLLGGLVSVTSASQADFASIAKCAGSATADHFLASLNELINEAATCNPIKAMDITTKVDALLNSFAADELDCLKDNVAANQVIDAMGITGLRSDAIQKKIVSYIMAHLITACGDMHTLSSDLAKNDWTNFGAHAGKMLLKVFNAKSALRGIVY